MRPTWKHMFSKASMVAVVVGLAFVVVPSASADILPPPPVPDFCLYSSIESGTLTFHEHDGTCR
ncbi:hypothetical protein [Streptomyces sp. NBC_01727]|uniref:hypothetical protein n=1 Tax=unclassified Streptomyces TaxID=2593676 RepID=UPI002E1554D7|nr:hypothetical protein OIE76_03460 [Streptomyces sp. NBC_01727]